MNESKLGAEREQMGIMKKGLGFSGGKRGGSNIRTGNHGTSANSSSHAESSRRLNELTAGASLFQHITTCIEKDDFLRRRRLGPCRTLKGLPLKPGRTGGIKK